MEVEANKNEITGIKEQMKDIQTNLKVVENFVGENVVLMDEKVKEEVEHQPRSELGKSMKSMEDRMKKFEKTIKNAATSGSYNVVLTPRIIQPPTYDGQTPWSSYK